jgi:hypothetical protein
MYFIVIITRYVGDIKKKTDPLLWGQRWRILGDRRDGEIGVPRESRRVGMVELSLDFSFFVLRICRQWGT